MGRLLITAANMFCPENIPPSFLTARSGLVRVSFAIMSDAAFAV